MKGVTSNTTEASNTKQGEREKGLTASTSKEFWRTQRVCEQLFLSGQYGETVGIKLSNTSPSVCKVSL